MPHPAKGYRLLDGTPVPSVTQITGRFKDSSALMIWAFKEGQSRPWQGERLYQESEKAAAIGTVVHAMAESDMKNESPAEINLHLDKLDDAGKTKAQSAYGAYLDWAVAYEPTVIANETSMVSELYKFGGTPDFIGHLRMRQALALFDIKTSSGIYSEYLVQVAAYASLWNENHPDQLITGGYHILRFAKTNGDFQHAYFPNLDEAWKLFLLWREAFDLDKQLQGRV